MKLNGSEIIVECLKEQGVDTVFGYPGGAILNVYDALYKHSDEITHILTSHEQGAAHAADGYARATGKVGVCFATSGPGATNLVTGIATSYMDSTPVVAITCNVTVPLLGKDSFQEVDIQGVTMPITKHNFIVKDVSTLADTIRKAFRIAQEGRPGPVLIDVTKDATAAECDYVKETPKPIERKTESIREEDIDTVTEMIAQAKKPFVFVGGGVVLSGASEELARFVHKIDAPVADSLMGKGAFDNSDPLYTGMLGMHGTKTSNYGVSECDLLIAIGARFSDRVTGNASKFASNAKIIHFDVDAAEINKNIKTDACVIGDALEVLKRVNSKIGQLEHHEWIEHIKELKEKYPMRYRKDCLNGPYIMETINEITDSNAIIATDVGHMTKSIVDNLEGSEFILLESNYDTEVLRCCAYPYSLKSRIASDTGHLSNIMAGKTISYLLKNGKLSTAMLGHLSKESNFPELAYQTVVDEIISNNSAINNMNISVASRDCPSKLITL